MRKLHDAFSTVGTFSGVIAWNASSNVDLLAKVATIICAAHLVLSWVLRVYARLKAVREGKKSADEAADEFDKEGK